MPPRIWPTSPDFANEAEEIVWQSLKRGLRPCDVLLHGLRITDPVDGDVEIDLVVLMPDCGAVVIEVKGGHVDFADGAVRQTGASGTQQIDPAGQAAKCARALARFVERQPDWSRGRLRVIWQVALAYSRAPHGLGPTLPAHVLLDQPLISEAAPLLFDRLLAGANRAPLPAEGWVEAALDHLIGGPSDEPASLLVPALVRERQRHADALTARQTTLLDAIRNIPRFEVMGPAGTGKSWLAMELSRRWARNHRVALVTYTRGVVEWMRADLADAPPTFLGTFFQLGYTWGIQARGPEDTEFWAGDGVRRMLEFARSLPDEQRFTCLIVDEGQDFDAGWWDVLLAACTPDARIAVFRDDEQTVFTREPSRPPVDLVPLVLDENLRNSTQIVDAFRPLVRADIAAGAGSAYPVEYWDCAADEVIPTADDAVAELVDQRGWLPEHVALLTTAHRHPVQVERDHDRSAYWAGLHEPEVFYGTVAGFKGLERSAIVLAVDGFHASVDPRLVLYTGMSRARDLLVVVGPSAVIRAAAGEKVTRRLLRGQRVAAPDDQR